MAGHSELDEAKELAKGAFGPYLAASAAHVKLTTNADHNGTRQSRSDTDEPNC